jgi:hypothetical protein
MTRALPIRATLRTLALATVALGTTASHANGDLILKDTAVAGTLATWFTAWLFDAKQGDCPDVEWRGRLHVARDKELDMVSVGAARGHCRLTQVGGWGLTYSPTLMAGRWNTNGDAPTHQSLYDVAAVPMLQWQHPMTGALAFDVELGIGPAYISKTDIGFRQKGSNFQFSDHFGLGFGDTAGRWRVGFAYRHISNAGIAKPNNAVDFKGVSIEWRP